jgi:hypothetical protein
MTGDVSVTGPERIWLHGIGDHAGETTWCDDPNPSGEPEELAAAVEYVRADLAAKPPLSTDAGLKGRARASFDANAASGEATIVLPEGQAAREILKAAGVETLDGGSIAWRGNIMPGHGIDAALIVALVNAAPALLDAAERVGRLEEALAPFAKLGSILEPRSPYSDFFVYRPAIGDGYALYGDHLRAAATVLADPTHDTAQHGEEE